MTYQNDLNAPTLANSLAGYFSQNCSLPDEGKQWFFNTLLLLSETLSDGNACYILSLKEQKMLEGYAKDLLVPIMLNPVFDPQTKSNQTQPLVLSNKRLYWYRHWYYEQSVAHLVTNMTSLSSTSTLQDECFLKQQLDLFFPIVDDEIDWQRRAAEGAVSHRFSLITGGPGTGKTTTVLRILALLQSMQPNARLLSIALAAPTGKAAVRLQESLAKGVAQLPIDATIKQSIPNTVTTIHKLLGTKAFSPYFKHHKNNPLIYDLIVIDEASMVDLALMAKLLAALKKGARLILLGDQDQLASVEVGFVLADLVAALPQNTFQLKKTWRFKGAIKALATAINQKDADEAWRLLTDDNITVQRELRPVGLAAIEGYQRYHEVVRSYVSGSISDKAVVYDQYLSFKVLCALRHGAEGVAGINQAIVAALKKKELSAEGAWYSGRPVMVTRNDPILGLFNGDIGICLPELSDDAARGSRLVVYFPVESGWKKVLPSRLVGAETAYAFTIHKSQGSEFATVLVSLPNQINALVTRELIYTAITRAKQSVLVASMPAIFKQGVSRSVARISGLLK